MATISLAHVSKRYGEVVAVRDVVIDIADGELLVLVGPSGCGKTTVLRLIAGLEIPNEGTIRVDGRVVNGLAPRDRNVSMVFEDYALYPHLAVRENLDFPLRARRTPAEEIRRRVASVAASMELEGVLERWPAGLAAGEAQHVAIGRAVVRDTPAAILLDDAFSQLDARQRLAARAELGRLHRELGTTIVSVTHDQAEALALGNRVAVMNAGVIEQAGPPRILYEHPATVFVAGFVGSPSMNLVEMTVEREAGAPVLRSGPLTLPAPAAIANSVAGATAGRVMVGFRPEHVRVRAEPGEGEAGFRGMCDLVEFLGHQVLVHMRVGDFAVTAFDDPDARVRVGDTLDCAIPVDRLHLFDAATGRAL